MILQDDVALLVHTVLRPLDKLGSSNQCFPFIRPQLVLDQFFPIEPLLHVRAVDHETKLVPLSDRLDYVLGRRMKGVVASRLLGVVQTRVVLFGPI